MNQQVFGEMEWRNDDLDEVRSAMHTLFTEHQKRVKQIGTHATQENTIASLRAALAEHLHAIISLETPFAHGCTIADVLDELLKTDTAHELERIRYYRFENTACGEGYYLLVDSAGYDQDTAATLRVGELVRFESSCPRERSDSFWAHTLDIPVAVTVDRFASGYIEPRFYPGCMPLVPVSHDFCEESLSGRKSTTWIDIPLSVCGKKTGKLTCDFCLTPDQLRDHQDGIVKLWASAQTAAPWLEFLYHHQQPTIPLGEIVADIQACQKLDQLFEYCTMLLPKYFRASNASIFTMSEDSFGMKKLVLQRSSFYAARRFEQQAIYRCSDQALTAWVARNGRALRIHNLGDQREREQQLDQYRIFDRHLAWEDLLTDSSNHTSYLAVPIPTDVKHVGGVLRLTEKVVGANRFTAQDQRLLEQIARDAVGRRLVSLSLAQASNTITYDQIHETIMVSNRVPKTHDVVSMLRSGCEAMFSQDGCAGKLFVLDLLTNDCQHFEHFTIGGGLKDELEEERAHRLDGSLTGYIVQEFLNNTAHSSGHKHILFVNDLQNARERQVECVRCNSVETAIASPVSFRRKVYGVILVLSNRHDISPETHGCLLKSIAAQAGMMYARRDHAFLTKLRREVDRLPRKDCVHWLDNVEKLFSSALPEETTLVPPQQFNLRRLVQKTVEGVGGTWACTGVPDVDVRVQQPALVGVMYGVLKDICTRSSGQPVRIRGDVRDAWIELTIEKFFKDADPLDGKMWCDSPEKFLGQSAHDDWVALSQKIAYYNEVKNRRGSVWKNRTDLILQLPTE